MTAPVVAALLSQTEAALLAPAEALWDLSLHEFQYVALDRLAKHYRQLDLDSGKKMPTNTWSCSFKPDNQWN